MLNWFFIYQVLFIAGSLILGFLWFHLQSNRTTPALRTFSYLILNAILVMGLQFLEFSWPTLSGKIFLIDVRFVLYTLYPIIFFAFVFDYTGKTSPFPRYYKWVLWGEVLVISALALTSRYHELFRYNYALAENPAFGNRLLLTFTYGPFFVFHIVYHMSLGAYILSVWAMSYRERLVRRGEFVTTLIATFVPLGMEILHMVGVVPFNFGPISNSVTGVVYWVGLFRYQLFDLRPIARSIVLEQMADGVVIADDHGRIIDLNPAAQTLMPHGEPHGRLLTDLLPPWETWQPHLQQTPAETFHAEYSATATYDVQISPLAQPSGQQMGWVLLFHDITLQKEQAETQARLVAFEERERIGRDLHDDIGQVLGYFNAQSQAIQTLLTQQKFSQAQQELSKLVDIAQESQSDIRRYILGLRVKEGNLHLAPPTPHPTDFLTTLTQYLSALYQQYQLEVDLHVPDDLPLPLLTNNSEVQLLRIIQEGLANVRKHAAVLQARLYIMLEDDVVRIVLEDKGKGFDPAHLTAEAETETTPMPHFGLQVMQERATSVNGTLKIKSELGKGTKLTATFPRPLEPTHVAASWRVLLVDDHALFREGLRTLLTVRGLNVVGLASNGREAHAQALALQPDLVLMDIDMPVCNGVEATYLIKADLPDTPIVMLTVSADDETLFAALRAGAAGYLLKDLDDDDFFGLLKSIMRGESVLSPGLVPRILAEFQTGSLAVPVEATAEEPYAYGRQNVQNLTARQFEVLNLIAQGLTYKEIAEKTFLSERTIRYHMRQIIETLQVKNRREAVALLHRP